MKDSNQSGTSVKKYFTRIRCTFAHVFVAIDRVGKANLEI
jgi:hypothetical protein